MGYTTITSSKKGLLAEMTAFVPLGFKGEIDRITLENTSDEVKNLKLFSLREWCLWDALDDMLNFQRNYSTGQVEVQGNVIYHKTEYRERRNHYAFFSVNQAVSGFDTQLEDFLGMYNGFDRPDVVFNGGVSKNSIAHGWQPCASHSLEVNLKPGQKQSFIFILGYVELAEEDKWEAPDVINKSRFL